jgi:hypothetical protein
MSDEWLSYAEAAERLNTTVEAVRLRALRGRWQKTIGNDKRPRIRLPDGWLNDGRTTNERRERKTKNDGRTTVVRTVDPALMHALETHNATLKADVERLEGQLRIEADRLAGAEARADRAIAEFGKLAEQLKTQLAVAEERTTAADARADRETVKAERALAEFSALAERLAALAEERSRPWWRRIVG